jgi:hypothetical protein
MTSSMENRIQPLWHDRQTSPSRIKIAPAPRQRRIYVVVALLLVSIAAGAGLLTWLIDQPDVHFVSCWVTKFRDPTIGPNSAADQDRLAIQRGGYFARADVASMPVHSQFLMKQQLDAVADGSDANSVVLYVGTYATVDKLGRIMLLSSDFETGDPTSGLALAEVLKSLARSPAKHKLLVLDIFAACLRPGLDTAASNVATALGGELAAVPDEHRLVLCSCSPGQVSLESESLQRTVFGYYFEQALMGYADGYNTHAVRDGRVSVYETAKMLRARVDRWAMHHRRQRQIPVLMGKGQDFDLAVCDPRRIHPPTFDKVAKYPAWLLQGWKRRDQWQRSRIDQLDPRAFATLEASLLRIEHKWRFGAAEAKLKSECERTIAELQERADRSARELSGPAPPSLAAVIAGGRVPDEQTVKATAKVLDAMGAAPAGKPTDRETEWQKQLVDFDKQTSKVEDVDIALSVLHAATSGGPLTPEYLQTLARLLQHRQLGDQWIETRMIHRLAEQSAKQAAAWSTQRASQLMRMVRLREKVVCCFETMPWMSQLLEKTAQACHDADVYYWAHRFVPIATIDHALSSAEADCEDAAARESVFVDAHRQCDDAMRTLSWSAEYTVRTGGDLTQWEAAVDAVHELAKALETTARSTTMEHRGLNDAATATQRPSSDAPKDSTRTDHQRKRLDDIQKASSQARSAVELVFQSYSSTSIRGLIARCHSDDARPEILGEVDAVLATPLVATADRVALWSARAKLARHLHEQIACWDYQEYCGGQNTVALAGYDPDAALRVQTTLAHLRHQVALHLLQLAGATVPKMLAHLPDGDGSRLLPEQVAGMSHVWSIDLRQQIEHAPSAAAQERLSRLYPPLKPLPLLDDPATNPSVRSIARRQHELWSWLADRYRYETLDGTDPQFYAKLAVRYAPYWREQSTATLQTDGAARIQPAGSDPLASTCDIAWSVGEPTCKKSPPIRIDILNPGKPWLDVAKATTQHAPTSPLRLSISLAADAAFNGQVPLGFLVRWQIGSRSFHRPVEVPTLAAQSPLSILLSKSDQAPANSLQQIVLRPNTRPEPHYLFVRNRGLDTRKIVVQLNSGAASGPLEIGAGDCVRVQFPPPKPSSAVSGDKSGGGQLAELDGPLVVTLLDGIDQKKLCSKTFPTQLLAPRQYVEVSKVRFVPNDDRTNRLEVHLRALGEIAGPPCQIRLDISAAHVPGLVGIGDGVLQGTLPGGGKPLLLVARDLQLADSAPDQGRFFITVDGVPRTFIFDTTFARGGDPTTPSEVIRPQLRLTAPANGRSGGPCKVNVLTDCAPGNSQLLIRLGRQESRNKYIWERTIQLPSVRQRRFSMLPGGKGGALLFQATLSDWDVQLDTAGLVGRRTIEVHLVDTHGSSQNPHSLAMDRQEIVLGNQPPQGVQIVDIPAKAWSGQPLEVTATARQSVPEVNRVVFFLGKPESNTIPKDAVTAEGTMVEHSKRLWTARLPLQAKMKGKTNVSVQFTNAAGLSSYATAAIELTDTDVGGGAIVGTVVEGTIPQHGLEVVLKDDKGTVTSKATTASDGSFAFNSLKPGKYELTTSKPVSGRSGSATVTVHDNTSTQTTIELWLQ